MLEITKIPNGFRMREMDYSFQEYDGKSYEIISESQVHVGTNDGVMFLDLSVSINGEMFTDINAFVNTLFS